MLKYKKFRESFGGFPTRCVGCLLAVILLLSPFTAFAFNNTTSQSTDFSSSVPAISTICAEAYVNNKNTLVFWDRDNDIYYLITQDDYITKGYNFQVYGNTSGTVLYGSFALTPNMASDLKVYKFNPSTDLDWIQITLPYNGIGYYSYFDITGMYLYAFLPINPATVTVPNSIIPRRAIIVGTDNNTFSRFEISTKYNIDTNTFELDNYTAEDEENVQQLGFWSRLFNWLEGIYTSIINLPSNLSQFFSNLGGYITTFSNNFSTFVSNFGSSIWNAIKSPFEGPETHPPNGGIIYRLWVSLQNLPSAIWNAIKAPFGDTTETPPNGGLLWRMWQSIKAPFVEGGVVYEFVNDLIDDIKSLFVPTEQQWSDMRDDYEDLLSEKFGFIYQSYSFIRVLFGDDSDRRVSHVYPRMYQNNGHGAEQLRSGSGSRDVEVVHTIKDLFIYQTSDDITITVPTLFANLRINNGRPQRRIFMNSQQFSLNSILNNFAYWSGYTDDGQGHLSSMYTFDFWSFWNLAVSAIFTILLISNALRLLGNIFGADFDYISSSEGFNKKRKRG